MEVGDVPAIVLPVVIPAAVEMAATVVMVDSARVVLSGLRRVMRMPRMVIAGISGEVMV